MFDKVFLVSSVFSFCRDSTLAQGSAAECERAAAVYREGQRALLREALGALGALETRGAGGLPKGEDDADLAGRTQKKPRL